MDPEIASLAATAATTLVNAIAGDTWNVVRDRFARLFASPAVGRSELTATLDRDRDVVVGTPVGARETALAEVEADWLEKFTLLLRADPSAQEAIRGAIQEFSNKPTQQGSVTLRAEAYGQARVYQQGQGIQNNG